jgi:hypothetical protein
LEIYRFQKLVSTRIRQSQIHESLSGNFHHILQKHTLSRCVQQQSENVVATEAHGVAFHLQGVVVVVVAAVLVVDVHESRLHPHSLLPYSTAVEYFATLAHYSHYCFLLRHHLHQHPQY